MMPDDPRDKQVIIRKYSVLFVSRNGEMVFQKCRRTLALLISTSCGYWLLLERDQNIPLPSHAVKSPFTIRIDPFDKDT